MAQKLEKAMKDVLRILEAIPLAPASIRYYGCCYRNVLLYCTENGITSFSYENANDFFSIQMERANSGEIGNIYAWTIRKAAFMLADYYATGVVLWKRRDYHVYPLSSSHQNILADFEISLAGSLATGSITLIIQMVRKFLIYLGEQGCDSISSLGLSHLRSFIIQEAPNHSGNRVNLTWPIKKFLGYTNSIGLTDINAGLILANPVPARKKVLPCLENGEIQALFSSIDKDTALGKRDYAIMRLALDTGLRWSDIANMELSDIDWRKKELHVTQEKTASALVLPLTVAAGNAMADYILNARPKCSSNYVFLRLRRPYDRLQSPAANIMNRYHPTTGFVHHAGDGKSFHAFRRTIGTNLLKSEVPLSTISQILGHHSLESTKRYLSLHDEMLLSCCMDIGIYATEKEALR